MQIKTYYKGRGNRCGRGQIALIRGKHMRGRALHIQHIDHNPTHTNEKQMPQYCDRFYMMAFYQFENRGLGL
jgi:hypothetical protein